jgi:hypothetical protein
VHVHEGVCVCVKRGTLRGCARRRSLTPLNKRTSAALAKMYNLYSYKNSEIR